MMGEINSPTDAPVGPKLDLQLLSVDETYLM